MEKEGRPKQEDSYADPAGLAGRMFDWNDWHDWHYPTTEVLFYSIVLIIILLYLSAK